MPDQPVNLRLVRKARQRERARAEADANAVKFGRPVALRKAEEAEKARAAAQLSGHRLVEDEK